MRPSLCISELIFVGVLTSLALLPLGSLRVTFYHKSPGLRDCVSTYFEGYRWDKGIYGVSDKERHVAICAETVKAVYRPTSS